MRLLAVTPYLPYRGAPHGGGLLLSSFIEEAARRVTVALLSFATAEEAEARDRIAPGLAAITLVPRTRPFELSQLRRAAWRTAMAARMSFRGLPLAAAKFRSGPFRRALRDAIASFRPDIVLLEYGLLAQYLPDVRGAVRVVGEHESGIPVGQSSLAGRFHARAYLRRFYPEADLVLVLSPEDGLRVGAAAPGSALAVRRPGLPVPGRTFDPGSAPPVAAFLGNASHAPNREAALAAVHDVFPLIRRRIGAARLLVAGPGMPATFRGSTVPEGVEIRDFVDDPGEVLGAARLLLAPVGSGGGVRIKALLALAHGLPVVTTPLGAQGLSAFAAPALQAGVSTDELAEAAARLLSDDAACREAGELARRIFVRHHAIDVVVAETLAILETTVRNGRRPR